MKFSGNLHDNAAKAPLPHHLGRVQAGHVEVQLATYYVVEIANKTALKLPGSEGWSIKRKLRLLRKADLGPERHAVIFLNSHPCSSCLKYVQALMQYTKITFCIEGGAGIGPMVRSKTGRNKAAVDLVRDGFPDLDAHSDLSDHEITVANEARPVADDTRGGQSCDYDSESTEGTMTFTPPTSPPPPAPSSNGPHTRSAFAPEPEEYVQTFQEKLQPYKHVPKRKPQRETRNRTYKERIRYRNPWPVPILTEPEYLASDLRNTGDNNNNYRENNRNVRSTVALFDHRNGLIDTDKATTPRAQRRVTIYEPLSPRNETAMPNSYTTARPHHRRHHRRHHRL